jgi:hypothetical protein
MKSIVFIYVCLVVASLVTVIHGTLLPHTYFTLLHDLLQFSLVETLWNEQLQRCIDHFSSGGMGLLELMPRQISLPPLAQQSISFTASTQETAIQVQDAIVGTKGSVRYLINSVPHPDAEMLQATVQSKLVEPLSQQWTSLLERANAALENRQSLSNPYAQVAEQFWQTSVVVKLQDTLDVLARSPLAKSTQNLVSEIQTFNLNSAKFPIASIRLPVPEITKVDFGEEVMRSFNSWLDKYPKLRLSSSEFVSDFVQNDFLPRYESIVDFLNRSPLAQSTRKMAEMPSSELANNVLAAARTKAQPLTDAITFLVQRIATRIAEPVISTAQSLATVGEQLTVQVSSFQQSVPSLSVAIPAIPPAPSIEQLQAATLVVDIRQISELLQSGGAALSRASASFSEQLADKLSILAENTASAIDKVGTGVTQIAVDATKIVPERSAELLQRSSERLAVQREQSQEQLQGLLSQASIQVPSVLEQTLQKVSQWRLFSDENHWEKGYWEQQTRSLTQLAQELSSSAVARERLLIQAQDTLIKAQDRFFAQTAQALDRAGVSGEVLEQASFKLREALREAAPVLQSLQQLVTETSTSFAKEARTLLGDTSHYVEDFITSGQALD